MRSFTSSSLAASASCLKSNSLLPLLTAPTAAVASSTRTRTTTTRTTTAATGRSAFSTTARLATKTVKPHLLPSALIPPYPYGDRRVYKQSNRGLYGTARIQFGNNIAPKHNTKTQRFWRPNIQTKSYYSKSIGATVKTRVSTRVVKTIRKEGGLEEYLLKSKPARIKDLGPGGWKLRWLLMQTRAVQERFNEEREKLGLDKKEVVDNDDVIQYALDAATPGPLSLRSKATLEGLRAAGIYGGGVFTLGDPDMEDDMVEGASGEVEEVMMPAELEGEDEIRIQANPQAVLS